MRSAEDIVNDFRTVTNRRSGYYWVRINEDHEWEVAHWNKTFQFWSLWVLLNTRLEDSYFKDIDEQQIKRES